jgi:hypothetical protein
MASLKGGPKAGFAWSAHNAVAETGGAGVKRKPGAASDAQITRHREAKG